MKKQEDELYCLSFNPNVNKEEREESWNFMDLMADYKRMGVPNNLWVATAANSEYRVSHMSREKHQPQKNSYYFLDHNTKNIN